jgi:hypothetical protein
MCSLVPDAPIAGSVLGLTAGYRVVLCGSGASTTAPERAIFASSALVVVAHRQCGLRVRRGRDDRCSLCDESALALLRAVTTTTAFPLPLAPFGICVEVALEVRTPRLAAHVAAAVVVR